MNFKTTKVHKRQARGSEDLWSGRQHAPGHVSALFPVYRGKSETKARTELFSVADVGRRRR